MEASLIRANTGAEAISPRVIGARQLVLSAAHACSDMNQGALSAILPFLIASRGYDYATAATLVMASNIVGSIVQPVFGALADRGNRPWVMALGLLMAGGGMALTGIMPSYTGLIVAVMVSGCGIAMFHPQAAKLVNAASASSVQGRAVSIFSFGGNVGNTLGPVLAMAAIGIAGLPGMLVFFIPEMLITAAILRVFGARCQQEQRVERERFERVEAQAVPAPADDRWGAFARLAVVVFGRSIVLYGMNTFLALFWINELGQPEAVGSIMLSVFYGIGAASTLLGGQLADRFGFRAVIRVGTVVLVPAIVALACSGNAFAATVAVVPAGMALSMVYSPMVVLGQRYLPNHMGLASGVTLGLAVSVGGIMAPLLGLLADAIGLRLALLAVAAIAIVPLAGALSLPRREA